MMNSELVPSSLVEEVAPLLRVANEVEPMNSRVAYLCRFYAYEKAHSLDPKSIGRGVQQFKTSLIRRLEHESETTYMARKSRDDISEMKNFYQDYYQKYIEALGSAKDRAERVQLERVHQTASLLFEILKVLNPKIAVKLDNELSETNTKSSLIHAPCNRLPLAADQSVQAIIRHHKIKASVAALCDTKGLPWPKEHENTLDQDILEWLQATFGFQKDNVEYVRGHLILLLANVHITQPVPVQQSKLDDLELAEVMKNLLKNYKKWCKYLGRKSSLWLPVIQQEVRQRKLLYMCLYLLIWGEAENLKFMPECIYYIYHHMAFELYGMLSGNISPMTGENIKPAYGGDEKAFSNKVVTPIVSLIAKEVEKGKDGIYKRCHMRNQYFWSANCFRLGWPMRADADFFWLPIEKILKDRPKSICFWKFRLSNMWGPGEGMTRQELE